MIIPENVGVVAIVFGTMGVIGFPLVRAFARRIEGVRPAASLISADLSERLDRIERAVTEAVGVLKARLAVTFGSPARAARLPAVATA